MNYLLAVLLLIASPADAKLVSLSLQQIRDGEYADREFFFMQGYVVTQSEPCECPPNAICDPCPPSYVLLWENAPNNISYPPVMPPYSVPPEGFSKDAVVSFVVIFTTGKERYEVGKPYSFTLRVEKNDDGSVNFVQEDSRIFK